MANMLILLLLLSFGASALEVTSPPDYAVGTLASGGQVYSDRDFTFTDVGAYAGYEYVIAKNNDKLTATITITNAGKLYIAASGSQGLEDWSATGESIGTTDRTLTVYEKDFGGAQASIGPTCVDNGCSMHVVMAAVGPPPDPFTGKVTALWSHDYKAEDGSDVDVLSYGVYAQGQHVREVQDDDTGNISTEFLFPSEVSVSDGTEWCVQVDAASAEARSGMSVPVCVVLKNEGPIVVPTVPYGVQLQVTQ